MEYNTKIGEFCSTHSNWEELLSSVPYYIKIKKENGYVIFNYNQIKSDFNNQIVREARGIIFEEGKWENPVCHAFNKFGNYGEVYVPEIDWNTAKVSQKIDGSIIKLWNHKGHWNVSTNSNVYAKESDISDIRRNNFEQVFWEGVDKYIPTENRDTWLHTLDTSYTYIFELVSPYNRVVIPYDEVDVYFLGARNNITNYQFGCDEESANILHVEMFNRPKLYPLNSYDEVVNASKELSWDEEGYVVYDKYFNRCKIKSPKYVTAHYARNNNCINRKHLIDVILKGEVSEFLIYASEYTIQINQIKDIMDQFISKLDSSAEFARGLRNLDRPEAAKIIKNFDSIVHPIMFINYQKDMTAKEYIENWNAIKWDKILDYIKD